MQNKREGVQQRAQILKNKKKRGWSWHMKSKRPGILVQGQCTGGACLLSAAGVKCRPKLPGSGNGLCHLCIHSIAGGRQDRSSSKGLGAGAEAERSKDADYWLAPLDFAHLIQPSSTGSGMVPPRVGWATSINQQSRNCPIDTPTDPSDGDNSSTEVVSSQVGQQKLLWDWV